jgi:NHLM bacteriocin system ABC transporter ATP-binding protein
MNALPQVAIAVGAVDPVVETLEPGAVLPLGQPDTGWIVRSGAVELYAVLWQNGAAISGRHYLFTVKAGETIAPLLCGADDLMLLAVATENAALLPTTLHFLADGVGSRELRPSVVAQLDRWLHGVSTALAPIVGLMPSNAVAYPVGDEFTAHEGNVITSQADVAWLFSAGGRAFAWHDGEAIEPAEASIIMPVPSGLWLLASAEAAVVMLDTVSALQQRNWLAALRAFHAKALALLLQHLEAREHAAAEVMQGRADRTARTLDRTIGRFVGILDHAPAWTGASAPDEKLLGPFIMVAEALGIELTQRVRQTIARAETLEDAARFARIRSREIALRGIWWKQDFGPFIGFLGEERKPVAVLPIGRSRYRMTDPDGGADQIVTAALAAQLAPIGHMLYRPLPAKPIEFKDLLLAGWTQNRGDFAVALVASLLLGILGLATPVATRFAFDRFIPSHEMLQLSQLAIGLVLVALISIGFRAAYDMAFLRIDGRMAAQTQASVIDRVLRLPHHVLRFSATDLAQRATSAENVRRGAVNFMLGSLAAAFTWLCNGALMLCYAPFAALAALGCFLLLLLVAYICAHRQLDAIRRGEELLANVNTIVFHLINGISVLRTTGSEDRAFARWGHDFAEMRARSYRSQAIGRLFEICLAGSDTLTLAGVFFVLSFIPAKDLSTGAFVSFVSAYAAFMAASSQLARGMNGMMNLRPSWQRAAPLFKAVPESGEAKRDPGVLSGAVELTNIAFRYMPDTPYVLAGLSLKAAPGELIAVVGASGSGKSTAMRMLLGFDQPHAGTVQFDGIDLRHLDIDLVRRQIGVVLQNGKLVPGSIYENIMGPHRGTLDDAWTAARQAGLEADIKALPMGMHTVLTEATAAFSGGQVQRMMIARALLGKPRILVLDEATSALDNVTQAIVTESLSRLAITRIIIAHRFSTVQQADRIYVVDHGRVVQSGKFDELMAADGPFAELARRQLM